MALKMPFFILTLSALKMSRILGRNFVFLFLFLSLFVNYFAHRDSLSFLYLIPKLLDTRSWCKLILIVQTRRGDGTVPRSGAAADGRGTGEGHQAHHERLGQVGH